MKRRALIRVERRVVCACLMLSLVAVGFSAEVEAKRGDVYQSLYDEMYRLHCNRWECWSEAKKAVVVGGLVAIGVTTTILVMKKARDNNKSASGSAGGINRSSVAEYQPGRPLPAWIGPVFSADVPSRLVVQHRPAWRTGSFAR